jgi:hypothetical protein
MWRQSHPKRHNLIEQRLIWSYSQRQRVVLLDRVLCDFFDFVLLTDDARRLRRGTVVAAPAVEATLDDLVLVAVAEHVVHPVFSCGMRNNGGLMGRKGRYLWVITFRRTEMGVHGWSSSSRWIAQLSADNVRLGHVPFVIADGTPLAPVQNFHVT